MSISVGLGLVLSAVVPATLPASAAPGALELNTLQVNGLESPLGIGDAPPVFSWKTTSSERGVVQTAYEVRVSDSEAATVDGNVWSTGKVASDDQLHVTYDGVPLESQTRYTWQARAWDNHDSLSEWSAPAWFETGLWSEGEWDASWIGSPDPSARLAKWTDYTVSVDFVMTNMVLGLYARAESPQNGYMTQLSVVDGVPKFRPHVKVDGNFTLLEDKDISSFISVEELTTGEHNFTVTFEGSTIISSLDGVEIDRRSDDTFSQGYVGFRQYVIGEGPESSNVLAIDVQSPSHGTLLHTDFSDGQNPFTAGQVVDGELQLVAPIEAILRPEAAQPLLRKDFSLDREMSSARLYASARGVYEASINGNRVGNELLAPGMTEYMKRIDYQTYDVTDLVTPGENSIGVKLGTGWYAGNVGSYGTGIWGDRTSFIGQLRIDYTDGSHEWISSDSSWTTAAGALVESDIIMGENYDARRVQAGWDASGFDDEEWEPVGVVDDEGAISRLSAQANEPVRVTEERPALSRTEITPGTWIYDMGQNMVGVARVELTGTAGSTAVIRHGETIYTDGRLYTENLRGAKATDSYTFAETGTATYSPTFTFHGFRYVEITGVTTPPTTEQVTGLVMGSDLPNTGTLETSSAMLNQLQSNIVWGQRGNFLSIPTDTPARDERLAWTGDINVFAPTASYNQDTINFLGEWLGTLRDSQGEDGDLPGVAPNIVGRCCGGGTGWSDAGITVPHTLWKHYGDTAVIRDNYDMMTRFMDFVDDTTGADLIRVHGGNGDWLNLDDPTDHALLGTAYYAYIAGQMSEMAKAIGKTDDEAYYRELSDRIKQAFVGSFLADDGTVLGNSQAGYAIAIGMGLIPGDRLEQVGEKYVAVIADHDYHLSTGFLGTPWLLPALTATGHNDVAYRLLNNDTFPSWGYEVKLGATTMWERWDAVNPDGSFADGGLNSFNHYAYGAVGGWMYDNIGGISATSPGYQTFDVAPIMGGGLTHAKGTLDSVYGMISSEWALTPVGSHLDVSVPVNTIATVSISAASAGDVLEGGNALDQVDGARVLSEDGETVVMEVGSGDYSFTSGEVEVDTTPPTVTLEVTGDEGSLGWMTTETTAKLSAMDEGSGVASIEYALGDGDWTAYTEPVAVPEGTTVVGYRATDVAGNVSAAETEPIRVDTTAPSSWGWLSTGNSVVSFAQDGVSGLAAIGYSLDGDLWYQGVEELLAANDAPTEVQLRATDVAGNVSDVLILTPVADAPTLTIMPGTPALIEASGFESGATVRVELDPEPISVLGTVIADAAGVASLDARIPADLTAGGHHLVFVVVPDGSGDGDGDGDADGAAPGEDDGTVTIPEQVIAETGSDLMPWALGGLLLLLVGGGLVVTRGRKRAIR